MKKKKIAGIALGSIFILTCCCGIFLVRGKSEKLSLKENQKYIYGYVTSIQGNEMTYMEVEEFIIETMLESETESTQKESAQAESLKKEETSSAKEETSSEKEEASRGERGNRGERSDMGSMPDMESMPDMGSISDMENMSDMESIPSAGAFDMEMTSTVTVYIPVGATVHTTADVSTTFSRLASGDLIKMLVETNEDEKDIIEEIWMLK